MTGTKSRNYRGSDICIQNNIIRVDDCTFPLSSITQIWFGKIPNKYPSLISALFLLFISLSGSDILARIIMLSILGIGLICYAVHYFLYKDIRGFNIKLSNGATYTFITDDEFSKKVLELISGVLANTKHENKYSISFKGDGDIRRQPEKKKAGKKQESKSSTIKNNSIEDSEDPLVAELNQLYLYYTDQDEVDADILELIENTVQAAVVNDKEKIKISYEKFIAFGLMKGCNELSLNLLINEIMSSIY